MADTIVQQHFFLVLSSGVRYIFWWRGWRHFTAASFLVQHSGVCGVFWWHGWCRFTAGFFLVLSSGVRYIFWWRGWHHFTVASFLVLPSGVRGVFWWRGRRQTSLRPDSPVPPSGPASKHHPNPRQRSNPRYACRHQSCPCFHSRAREWFKATNPVSRPLPGVLIQWSASLDDWLCGHACTLVVELFVSK